MTKMEQILFNAVKSAITTRGLRRGALAVFESRLEDVLLRKDPLNHPKFVQGEKVRWISSILRGTCRNLDRETISVEYLKKALNVFFPLFTRHTSTGMAATRETFKKVRGMEPPSFIVISPTRSCNLNCEGCYAASERKSGNSLPFDILDKIVQQVHDLWNVRFCILSGGEPLMYRDNGRTVFDIFEKYNDMFFMYYTNGTLIDDRAASRMLELGNVTPAISVEGFEEETDGRRGRGTFAKILRVQERLREHGVPFGLSVTATRENVGLLTGGEFYDFWFNTQGGTYMWMFHLMPIGRARDTMHLMITPEERLAIRSRILQCVSERQHTIADFWNSGILADGCIAYGKQDGYIYIDWDGKVMPCVFVPYYEQKIQDLFAEGKTITDALDSPLMVRGREWQCSYQGHPLECFRDGEKYGNLLRPCSIRDHYGNFRENILTAEAHPEEINAKLALEDEDYQRRMCQFGEELRRLSDPIWDQYFEKEWADRGIQERRIS